MGNLGGTRLLCLWSFPDLPVTGGQDKKFKPQGGIIKTFLHRPLVWRERMQSPVLEAHHQTTHKPISSNIRDGTCWAPPELCVCSSVTCTSGTEKWGYI